MLAYLGLPSSERGALGSEHPDAEHAALIADWSERFSDVAMAEPGANGRAGPSRRLPRKPSAAPEKRYAFDVTASNLPASLPAGWSHGARVTLLNTGNFAWRARAVGAEGRFERGEIALALRQDGEWVATHKLPRYEVHPGQSVTFHFALIAPETPGKRRLTFDLIEWDVAHFRDEGCPAHEHWLEVQEPSERESARLERVARRVNPWLFKPSGGVVEGSDGHLYPCYIARARGCRVRDAEGKEYIDYTMANASALLGHAEPRVLDAIRRVMEQVGPMTQVPNPLEIEVARLLCEYFPCAEMATFGKNGPDACTVAARMARAFTGKRHIL